MKQVGKSRSSRVWRWALPVAFFLAGTGTAAPNDADWELRRFGEAQVEMPKAWQVQRQQPNAIAYTFATESGAVLLFGYGWEEDPGGIKAALEGEGIAFADIGERTLLAGSPFLERELKGPADGDPVWLRQLVATNPGPDGRYLLIQYGVMGALDPGPYLANFERVLASLEASPETPTAGAQQTDAPTVPGAVPGPDHEGQVQAILKEILDLDDQDFAGIESRYLRIIDAYPDTEQAQESYWRLSNLYLQGYDPPRRDEAVALLERFLATYPGSTHLEEHFPTFVTPGIGLVQQRLLGLYQEQKEWQKALPLYQQFLPDAQQVRDEQLPYAPGYAEVLERLGRNEEALTWYRLYLGRAPDPDDFLVRIVRESIERLSGVPPGAAAATATAGPGAPTSPAKVQDKTATPDATPAEVPAATSAPGPDAATLAAEGRERLAQGDYAGALERLRASVAIKADPQLQERIKKLEAYLGASPARR